MKFFSWVRNEKNDKAEKIVEDISTIDDFKDGEMQELFERFIKSFKKHRDPRADLELHALKKLKGLYLEKAKSAILERLENSPDCDAVDAVRAINLLSAIPFMERWLSQIRSDSEKQKYSTDAWSLLAHTLYEFTNDDVYVSDVIGAVRLESYADYKYGIYRLSKMPLTIEGMAVVWEKYKNGDVADDTAQWVRRCADFLREKIQEPIGITFFDSLSKIDQEELQELIKYTYKERLEKKRNREKQIEGRNFYRQEDLNKFSEYVGVGGMLVPGLKLKEIWRGHSDKINSLAWSPDGESLASSSDDETIIVWGLEQGEFEKILVRNKKKEYSKYYPCEIVWLDNEKILSTYKYYSTPDEDINGIAIWDTKGEEVFSFTKPTNKDDYAFSSYLMPLTGNKEAFISRRENGAYGVFKINLGTFKHKSVLDESSSSWLAISLSPDQTKLAVGKSDSIIKKHQVIVYDLKTGDVANQFSEHRGHINDFTWLPGRDILVSASSDAAIQILDLMKSQEIKKLREHKKSVNSISVSSDGKLLASKSNEDNTVHIWDTDTWTLRMVLRELGGGHYNNCIAFHPHLPILATLCHEETSGISRVNSIRIWEFDYETFITNPPFFDNLTFAN